MISKQSAPLFSVIVLTYLQRHFLEECLDSIFRQTYPNIELVICDDCSADFCTNDIQAYIQKKKGENIRKVTVFRQHKNVGISRNAQKGVELSSGTFFKLLAGDDLLCGKTSLEKMSELLQSAGIVATRSRACQRDGTLTDHYYPQRESWDCVVNADAQTQFNLLATQGLQIYFHEPGLFWSRSLFDEIGGFDLDFQYVTDWPVLLKITGSGYRITTSEDIVVLYRYGGIMNRTAFLDLPFRKQYYQECAAILRKYGLVRFESEGQGKKVLRCNQAIFGLESRIVAENSWKEWSLGQQVLWRIKSLRFLFISALYRLRYNNFSVRSHVKTPLLVMAVCMALYLLGIQPFPGGFWPFLWSLLFFLSIVWLFAQTVGLLCIKLLNLILNIHREHL